MNPYSRRPNRGKGLAALLVLLCGPLLLYAGWARWSEGAAAKQRASEVQAGIDLLSSGKATGVLSGVQGSIVRAERLLAAERTKRAAAVAEAEGIESEVAGAKARAQRAALLAGSERQGLARLRTSLATAKADASAALQGQMQVLRHARGAAEAASAAAAVAGTSSAGSRAAAAAATQGQHTEHAGVASAASAASIDAYGQPEGWGSRARTPLQIPDEEVPKLSDFAALPPHGPGPYDVALIALYHGKLPAMLDYFAKSAATSKGLVRIIVLYTTDSPAQRDIVARVGKLASNLEFRHVKLEHLGELVRKAVGTRFCPLDMDMVELIAGAHGVMGSKFNDIKPLYGTMFEDVLEGATHWGWIDLDMLLGDLRSALLPYLPQYDVITFPDGYLTAIYTGGQLTVFRNIAYFRTFWKGTSATELFCLKGNRVWDEKYTIWHALRHPDATMALDYTQQFVGKVDSNWQLYRADFERGAVLRDHKECDGDYGDCSLTPRRTLAQVRAEFATFKFSGCVPWYGGWTFKCIPPRRKGSEFTRPDLVLEWSAGQARVLALRKRPTIDIGGKNFESAAFLHLIEWKRSRHHEFEALATHGMDHVIATLSSMPMPPGIDQQDALHPYTKLWLGADEWQKRMAKLRPN